VSQPAENTASSAFRTRDAAVERLAITGSGTIACGLAVCAADRGIPVLLWARSSTSAARALERIGEECERLDGVSADEVQVTTRLADLSTSTLVVEAVLEEEAAKGQVLRSLGEELAGGSLIATTTSSLGIAALAKASARPSQFFGLHVFNPVQRMPLVELCFPVEADRGTRARAAAFCEAIGKTAVEVPDEPGFVVNRLLFPYLFDAVRLLERTGLEPDEIDACMKLGASHPMGPLELLDLVGIDVAEAIGEALHADTGDQSHCPPGRVRRLVREGKVGRKSGAGFYDYR
jgi:3-hydroxybutyryl-CoA dehydrogenase